MISNNMLRGVGTGTDARSRIGNMIGVKYVKGAFTFNAAMISSTASAAGQGVKHIQAMASNTCVLRIACVL